METTERNYVLFYLDKEGNELKQESFTCNKPYGIKEAREYAKDMLNNSMLADLKKIKVKKQFETKF